MFDSPFVAASEALAAYARPSFAPGRPLAEAVLDFAHRIHAEFRYDPEATTLDTPVEDALRERHGVCQDFAHVMIGGLRSLGLPARYVSGYLKSRRKAKPEAKPAAEGELVGSEASHAWVAAWCPTLGWIEVDPTNDLVPSDRHIVLAWGRDYDDVSPGEGRDARRRVAHGRGGGRGEAGRRAASRMTRGGQQRLEMWIGLHHLRRSDTGYPNGQFPDWILTDADAVQG